jgi:DNA-binding NtrC family response regulator
MIQQRQAGQETRGGGGEGDDYLEELRNDHLGLVGGSPATVALRDLIRRVAFSGRPVLISGPTGSGKSLVADAIHRLSIQGANGAPGEPRSLARVNCAEVDEKNLELILFGTDRQPGLLGSAGAATLVLDDVHALPEGLQARMVRLLQTGGFRPIGSPVERRVSIRVVAITSRSLARCVRENTFRADLLYELGVLTVPVPGLDEHREDIPALVNHFLRLATSQVRFSSEALDVLAGRSWPGSVRELRNLVERAVVHALDKIIGSEAIRALCAPEPMDGIIEDSLASLAGRLLDLPIGNKLAAVEAALLESAMRISKGNKSAAARLLGLHRKAVERKLEKYDMRTPPPALINGANRPQPGVQSGAQSGVQSGVQSPRDRDMLGRRSMESLGLQT